MMCLHKQLIRLIQILCLFTNTFYIMGQNSHRCKKAITKMKRKAIKTKKNFKDASSINDNEVLDYVCPACHKGLHRAHHPKCPRSRKNKQVETNTPSLKRFFSFRTQSSVASSSLTENPSQSKPPTINKSMSQVTKTILTKQTSKQSLSPSSKDPIPTQTTNPTPLSKV